MENLKSPALKEAVECRQLAKYKEAFKNPRYNEILAMGSEVFQIFIMLPKDDVAYPHFYEQVTILRDYIHLLNKLEQLDRHEHQTLMTATVEIFTKEGEDLIEEKVWISRSKTLKEAFDEVREYIHQTRPSVSGIGEIILDGPLEESKGMCF